MDFLSLHSDKARPEGGPCLYIPTSLFSLKHALAEFRKLLGVCSQHRSTRVVDVFTFGQPLANRPGLSLHSNKPLKPWEHVVLHEDKPNCLIWADLSLQFDNPPSGIFRGLVSPTGFQHHYLCAPTLHSLRLLCIRLLILLLTHHLSCANSSFLSPAQFHLPI